MEVKNIMAKGKKILVISFKSERLSQKYFNSKRFLIMLVIFTNLLIEERLKSGCL